MFRFTYHIVFCVILLCNISLQQNYIVPQATIELLYPKGFSVSIPDEPGVSLFSFHGKLNEEFGGPEGGFYSRDISNSKNGKWTFTDKETRFKIGDTIHYWLYVIYSGLGYQSDFQSYTVKECPRNAADNNGICNAVDQNEYVIPDATVELLQPRGFKVSIPDHEGIKLFAFHGNINEEFNGREAGQFAKDITRPIDGRWTFIDRNTRFKPGDILYYWLYVIHRRSGGNDVAQLKEGQSFVISGTATQPPPTRPSQDPCRRSETTWNGNYACSGQLLLHEDFESLNSNWTKEIRYADDSDYEFVIYEEFDGNLNIKNGELYIKPILADDIFGEGFIYSPKGYDLGNRCTSNIAYDCKRQPVGGYALSPVFSGKITSTAYFKYGRVDIRAKLPKGDWIYPEFFLSPRLYEFGRNDYDSGQIRIAFAGGNKNLNNEVQGSILLGTSPYARMFNIKRSIEPEGWSNNYHIYSTIWKADAIIFLVDNKQYGKIIPPPNGISQFFTNEKPEVTEKWALSGKMAPFNKEMTLQIGVGVGGHSFPDTISGKPYNNLEQKPQIKFYNARRSWKPTWNQNELIVDYVKIYAL